MWGPHKKLQAVRNKHRAYFIVTQVQLAAWMQGGGGGGGGGGALWTVNCKHRRSESLLRVFAFRPGACAAYSPTRNWGAISFVS